ncbi:MAG: aspartate kinase [Patescibacteria group bacterium]|jgi:aspartokinase/homoserine dehydrogenase 1
MIDKVIKFGGTSVGSEAGLRRVLAITTIEVAEKRNIVIVVSAFSGVTNMLIHSVLLAARGKKYLDNLQVIRERHMNIIKHFFPKERQKKLANTMSTMCRDSFKRLKKIKDNKRYTKKDIDALASCGERFSAYIIMELLNCQGIKSQYVDGRDIIQTDSAYMKAKVNYKATENKIKKYWKNIKGVPVVTGFIAADKKKQTTTMGRGTSDYTAAILGAALQAKVIEIWTDVDGLYSADPKKKKKAKLIEKINYAQAIKMAKAGAKVLHPLTMVPAQKKNIPIIIKNTYNFQSPGTIICN